MEWLVGIIVLILAIRFWRISLPLIVVAALVIGGFLLYEDQQSKRRKAERERNEADIARHIREAKETASAEGKKWELYTIDDPASGEPVPRLARVQGRIGSPSH